MTRRTLFLALLAALALGAETKVETPFQGVTHISRTEESPRKVSMHIVRVDLSAHGIRIKLSGPGGTREAVRQTTLEFLKQEQAHVAVNGHFFLPFPSPDSDAFLIGLAASDGNVYSDFESPEQSYALVKDAPAIHVSKDNEASIVTKESLPESLFTAFSGSAQIVTGGKVTIPVYKDGEHPEGLLTPGGPNGYSNAKSWYDVATARTVVGLAGRELIFFTVDRAGGSLGMTLREVAELLVAEYGVTDALNMDGGGSTSLAMQGPDGEARLVNVPSDPGGRKVASSIAVFAESVH